LAARAAAESSAFWLTPLPNNHIHLIVIPPKENSMAVVRLPPRPLLAVPNYFNTRTPDRPPLLRRFFSCPLEDNRLWAALRYVERNPVRAGLIVSAADWEWSSARAHLGFGPFPRGLDREFWEQSGGVQRW
jgi:putative transposase